MLCMRCLPGEVYQPARFTDSSPGAPPAISGEGFLYMHLTDKLAKKQENCNN